MDLIKGQSVSQALLHGNNSLYLVKQGLLSLFLKGGQAPPTTSNSHIVVRALPIPIRVIVSINRFRCGWGGTVPGLQPLLR
jgi:hypothetical protein|uniref:Uncharacterized protein n=1 Tax=Picea sitchensis TaxID=3332 RepID=A0A6B9XY41_PICSI|nr:hypothetical protein Q903MT_gene5552 [Picea sitchensis]